MMFDFKKSVCCLSQCFNQFSLELVNCVQVSSWFSTINLFLMIDDRYIKDLTNKFFETQLQHNDTIDEYRFPNHVTVLADLVTIGHFDRYDRFGRFGRFGRFDRLLNCQNEALLSDLLKISTALKYARLSDACL